MSEVAYVAPPINRVTLVKSREELGSRIRYNVEGVWRVGSIFLIHGWILDPDRRCRGFMISKPASKRIVDAAVEWTRFPRKDVADTFPTLTAIDGGREGFAVLVDQISDPEDATTLTLTLLCRDGKAYSEYVRVSEFRSFRDAVTYVFGLTGEGKPDYRTCRKLFQPFIQASLGLRKRPKTLVDEVYGSVATDPSLSIVIPIYGGLDLMQFQAGNIVPTVPKEAEVIFAIDDPRLLDGARTLADRLTNLLPISMRLIAPDENLGFAGINNFAAEKARGRNLLLLNSDCFVTDEKCLARVIATLDAGTVDLLGARLLFADLSIQHDGVAFEKRADFPGFILNSHPHKGMPSSLIGVHGAETSVALTAAFLAIRASAFKEIGGFDEGYVRGDFEDTDLCLNAINRGWKIGIMRDTRIYHLERQSQNKGLDSALASKITLANAVRQMTKWEALLLSELPKIEVVM